MNFSHGSGDARGLWARWVWLGAVGLLAAVGLVWVISLRSGRAKEPGTPSGLERTGGDSVRADGRGCVLVVSKTTGRPIAGARLTWTPDGSGPLDGKTPLHTDAQGRARVPQEARGTLRITAPGYVGWATELPLAGDEQRVVLAPTGSLWMRLTDKEGRPVQDVEIQIALAAELAGSLQREGGLLWEEPVLAKRSGADGRILWPELVPAKGYRWGLPPGYRTEEPLSEGLSEEAALKAGESGAGPAAGSGLFEILEGQRTQVDLKVSRSASVSGILGPAAGNGRSGIVRLFRREIYRGSDGKVLAGNTLLERAVPTDAGGGFAFRNVQPGSKHVFAQWREDSTIGFAGQDFTLNPGEDKALGILQTFAGVSATVRVSLRCNDAVRRDLAAKGALQAQVGFMSRRIQGSTVGSNLTGNFLVKVDEPVRVTGLAEGEFIAQAQLLDPPPGLKWRRQGLKRFTVPGEGTVELVIEAKAEAAVVVTALPPKGANTAFRTFFFPDSERDVGILAGDIPAGTGSGDEPSRSFTVPAGSYTVWLLPGETPPGSTINYFGEARIQVEEGRPNAVRVVLGPGAIVRGRVTDLRGHPVTDSLTFQVVPFLKANDPSVLGTTSDSEGRFVLYSVPPGRSIQHPLSADSIAVGAAGSETHADLTIHINAPKR